MRTFVATGNAGKLTEMRAIFAGTPLVLETDDAYVAVPEGASNYTDNALHKARALHASLCERGIAAAVLADDSGIEVDALGGRPGVLSARYAGEDVSWPQRRRALLDEIASHPQAARTARFVSVMALVREDGTEIVARGEVEGRVTETECGAGGFGYDPIFFYPPAGRTFAELSEDEKNRWSHRRLAATHLLEQCRFG